MPRQPNLADLLAPAPPGRVRVLLDSPISTTDDTTAAIVRHEGRIGACVDMAPAVAKRYIDSGQGRVFAPNKVFADFAAAAGVASVGLAAQHSSGLEKALKAAGIRATVHQA